MGKYLYHCSRIPKKPQNLSKGLNTFYPILVVVVAVVSLLVVQKCDFFSTGLQAHFLVVL